jgi:hypothetical protein
MRRPAASRLKGLFSNPRLVLFLLGFALLASVRNRCYAGRCPKWRARRAGKQRDSQKDRPIRDRISDTAHHRRSRDISRRIEGLITSETSIEVRRLHHSQRDCRHGRAQDRSDASQNDLRQDHQGKDRFECESQRCGSQKRDPGPEQKPIAMRRVDQRACRGLRNYTRDSSARKDHSHLLRIPMLSRQVNRQEWTNSRLYVGKEKNSASPACGDFLRWFPRPWRLASLQPVILNIRHPNQLTHLKQPRPRPHPNPFF